MLLAAMMTAWIPGALLTLPVLLKRRSTLANAAKRKHVATYVALLVLESLALAAQLVGLLALITPTAWQTRGITLAGWALVNVTVAATLALDTLLFIFSGMRLQRSLLTFSDALHEFADGLPWRQYLTGLGFALLAFAYASALGFAYAGVIAIPTAALLLALGVSLALLTQVGRGRLPLMFSYEWNNRIIDVQGTLVRSIRLRLKSTDDSGLVNDSGVPRVFTNSTETFTPAHADYPLLHANTGFVGKEHFKLRLNDGDQPHVVMVFLESFRAADVGVVNPKHKNSITPQFDALSREGVLWTNFFANGTITSRAMASAFFGVLPDFRQYSSQKSNNPPALIGLPQIFAERGYLPAFFSDGPLEWENKREFFLNHGFPLFFGAPSIKHAYPEAPSSVWNFSDEYLFRFHADWLARQDAIGRPTFSSLLTVSTHYPFTVPDGAPEPNIDIDKNTQYYKYLRTMMYTDHCLGKYIEQLRARGLDKKTVFIIMGDHGQQVAENGDVNWSGHYTSEGVRVPLLVLAPGRLVPTVIKETGSQVDILPTVLDMLNIRAKHHAVGSSLVREDSARQAISVHPFAPGMLANSFGTFRYVYNFDAQKSALYDTSRDSDERRDIAALHPALVKAQEQQVHLLRRYLDALYDARRIAPDGGKAYLKFPRLHDAPDSYPLTLEACNLRAQALMAQFGQRPAAGDEMAELGIAVVISSARGLSDAERLEFAQLLLLRAHFQRMGEMTNAESARLAELEERFQSDMENPGSPQWMRAMAFQVRELARRPRYPELRSLPTP